MSAEVYQKQPLLRINHDVRPEDVVPKINEVLESVGYHFVEVVPGEGDVWVDYRLEKINGQQA